MDDLDRKLISALRHDGRASLSDLSVSLGVTRSTVRARMDRLRSSGQVVGYTVVLKGDGAVDPVRALTMIAIEGRGKERIVRLMEGLRQVRSVHSTNGRWDLIVEIGADSLEELDDVLSQIRRFDGVSQSETNLLLSTKRASAPRSL
ncbi:MAG: Lrp/AsnC family transcriptional regulator [Pseudomonadota bacterium]